MEMNEVTEFFEPMVEAMEELVEGGLVDRVSDSMAKIARKCHDAFRAEGFREDQAFEFTKILLKKTDIGGQ